MMEHLIGRIIFFLSVQLLVCCFLLENLLLFLSLFCFLPSSVFFFFFFNLCLSQLGFLKFGYDVFPSGVSGVIITNN